MTKLTRNKKIQIYKLRKQGETLVNLAKKFDININHIGYLVKLIDYHGVKILSKKKNRHYNQTQKKIIIDEVLLSNRSVMSTSIKYGLLSNGMLFNWIKLYKSNNYDIVEKKKGRISTMKNYIDKSKEVKTSEELLIAKDKEILYLQAENEYLKKLYSLMQKEE